MAHLWIREPATGWSVLPLGEEDYALDVVPPNALSARPWSQTVPAASLLIPPVAGEATWFLFATGRGGVFVNGLPVPLGMRALADRDEIRLAGAEPAFFSTETLAAVAAYPGAERPVDCPRCLLPIEPGTPAVRCPRCGVWHHENAERNCWTYARTCRLCPQPTALDAGYGWSPEDL